MFGVIYVYTNLDTRKRYVGYTTNLQKRTKKHLENARLGRPGAFYDAIRKYGCKRFSGPDVIDDASTKDELLIKEVYWIEKFGTFVDNPRNNGYNLTKGGENTFLSIESRKKISESKIGIKNPMFGKVVSLETRKRLSNAQLKRIDHRSPSEHCRQRTAEALGNDWIVIFPDGHEETIRALKRFCRENNLNSVCMRRVAQGKQKHHKGYLCRKLER